MDILKIAQKVADVLEDKKAEDIAILDIKDLSVIADYFVICHGNSSTQVQALAAELRKELMKTEVEINKIVGYEAARWVLIDLGDVVIHIFHREEREYYNLERIWGDAEVVR